MGVPSYANEVKGHIPRSRVIWGQVRWNLLVFVIWVSFEKLKSDWNQTWVNDAMGFLCMLIMRAKIMYQGWGSSEVKSGGKCKIGITFCCWKDEVQLQPNLSCRCNMWTSYSVSGWDLVKLSFLSYIHVRYYDTGVPCKLLLPCLKDRISLLAVLFIFSYGVFFFHGISLYNLRKLSTK